MKNLRWFLITFMTIVLLDSTFDSGKWAIGRYTEVNIALSIFILIFFSALLAGVVELIHRRRRRSERREEQYFHHKIKVWVRRGQRGHHWEQSLCPECIHFQGDSPGNCHIESTIHATDKCNHTVSVVWECPKFRHKDPNVCLERKEK